MGRWSTAALVVLVALLAVMGVYQTGVWVQAVSTGEYETTTVTAIDANGSELAAVDARVANTSAKRLVGLSRTDALGADEGMVFVHEDSGSHAYVMRNMGFPLDIVFVAANGTVTSIEHAAPPDGLALEAGLDRHAGEGRYVLEVERGWTNRTGLEEGDRVRIAGYTDAASDGEPVASPCEGVTPDAANATAERPNVTAVDANGTRLGTVTVAIADNGSERYTGLSETASLGADEGMLFVYDDQQSLAFVMRNMSFPLDMVFVAENGTVTTIHHAPLPPEGTAEHELRRYEGTGQYVLEVNRGWTNRTEFDEGDSLCVPADL